MDSYQAMGQHCEWEGGTVGAWGSGVERKDHTSAGHRHTQLHRLSNTHAVLIGNFGQKWRLGGPLYPQARASKGCREFV